jgi:hypothetical protein
LEWITPDVTNPFSQKYVDRRTQGCGLPFTSARLLVLACREMQASL